MSTCAHGEVTWECELCRLEGEAQRWRSRCDMVELDRAKLLKHAELDQQLLGALNATVDGLEGEMARLRAALSLVATPPPDGDEFLGCAGCADVARRALDGHDFRAHAEGRESW